MKTVVVTGVSSGIGRALAEALVLRGWKVFGSIRSTADGAGLAKILGPNFIPIFLDVTDEASVKLAAEDVRKHLAGRRLNALVNNAGAVIAGPLALQPTAELRRQLDINLVGPFLMVKEFLPLLGSDPSLTGAPGRILNISSMAGKIGVPFMGAYVASKHGLEGYSDSLRCEVAQYGIDVSVITPGSVATPVFKKAQESASLYVGSDYEQSVKRFFETMMENVSEGHSPVHIANGIIKAMEASRPKYRYEIIWRKLAYWHILRLIPKRLLTGMMCKRYELMQFSLPTKIVGD
tara:strand:+ start:3521 stop:4396 length:876 start_codon:yes stop_codon:yes gene_type:complete